jgi:hypothetical protein
MATVTNLAELRKDRLHVLTDMLAHARIFVPGDLALDTEWRSQTHAAVEAATSEGGLAAEVRDLPIAPSAPARNPAQAMSPTAERGSKIPRGTLGWGV